MTMLRAVGVLACVAVCAACGPPGCPAGCPWVLLTKTDEINKPLSLSCAQGGATVQGAGISSCQYIREREVVSGQHVCGVNPFGSGYRCQRQGTCGVRESIANERFKCLCERDRLYGRLVFQVWPSLHSDVEGLVFTARNAVRPSLTWNHHRASHSTYWFSVNGLSPQVPYWPSGGEGVNFLSNWAVATRDGQTRRYNAAQFGPTTPNTLGLWDDAHIVQVEVNDGHGSDRNVHFVPTRVEVMDNKAGYPVNPAGTLREMWHLAEQHFASVDQAGAIDAALDAAVRKLNPRGYYTLLTLSGGIGSQPSWYAVEKCLRAVFVLSREHALRAPDGRQYTIGVQVWVEYEQCGCGAVTITSTHGPKAFWPQSFPVPPVGPPTGPPGSVGAPGPQ